MKYFKCFGNSDIEKDFEKIIYHEYLVSFLSIKNWLLLLKTNAKKYYKFILSLVMFKALFLGLMTRRRT